MNKEVVYKVKDKVRDSVLRTFYLFWVAPVHPSVNDINDRSTDVLIASRP